LELIPQLVQLYTEQFTTSEDAVLQQVSHSTRESHAHANMLSGHVQGKLLEFMSRLVKPHRVLEIGTFTGYSAICLSRGLAEGGRLHTIELREEDAATARKNFNLAGIVDEIILHTGNALDVIPFLNETWDMVFIDADKVKYKEYYQLVLPNLRKGGLIIADNVLFHGQVLEQPVTGKNPKAIHDFNGFVKNDESVETLMLSVRDGLLFILKK